MKRFPPVFAVLLVLATVTGQAHAATAGVQVAPIYRTSTIQGIDANLESAKELHAKIVRVALDWSAAEPVKGRFSASYMDLVTHFVDGAAARGLKPLLTVLTTPCWASSAPDKSGCSGEITPDSVSVYQPADPQDAAGIFGTLAQRFGPKLAAIEVWNEPDHDQEFYFKGPNKPAGYAALLKVAYQAVKDADRSVTVLAGSLVGANGAFLKALYQQGIKGHYDALDVHYYDIVFASLRAIRQVQRAAGDVKPVWLGEFGYTSCFPGAATQGGHKCMTQATQAQSLTDIFAGLRKTPWVKAAIVYDLQDNNQYSFGLTRMDGSHKPAFNAMKRAFLGLARLRKVELRITRRGGLRAVGGGPAGDAYELDVFKGNQLRYKKTFLMDRNNRFNLSIPAVLGKRGLRIKVYQYWTNASATRKV